jgi:hypothetical protein
VDFPYDATLKKNIAKASLHILAGWTCKPILSHLILHYDGLAGDSVLKQLNDWLIKWGRQLSLSKSESKYVPAQATAAYRGMRWRWKVNFTSRPLYPQGRTPVLTEQKAGLAPDPVWTVLEKTKSLVCTRTRTADRPART